MFMRWMKDSRLWMIVSMATFGTLAPFVRAIAVSSGELALYRAILACGIIGLFLILTRQKIALGGIAKDLLLLLFSGMAMGINWILLFEAYKYTTVSVATLSYYFAPVIVTLVCPFLFREKLTGKQFLCFVMSTAGLVLITATAGGGVATNHLKGVLFGLGAAVLYAGVVLVNKFIKGVGGLQRTLFQFIAAIVTLLPYVLLTGGFHLEMLDTAGWGSLLIVGIFHTGITYCLYFSSLKELPGQKAAILSYIDPLVAVFISVLVLKEDMNIWQAIGGLLILGFTLFNEISIGKKKPL